MYKTRFPVMHSVNRSARPRLPDGVGPKHIITIDGVEAPEWDDWFSGIMPS